MAVKYERDDASQTILATLTGPFVVDEILGVIDRQAAEQTWDYALFYDERGVTTVPTADQLRVLLKHVKQMVSIHGPRGPVAVMALRLDLYGMAHFYSTLSELGGDRLHVFHTIGDAETWLSQMTTRSRPRE